MRTRSRQRLETLGRSPRSRRRGYPAFGTSGHRLTPPKGYSAAPYLVLVVALILSVGWGILHNRWRTEGRSDPLLVAVRTVLFPFQYAVARTEASVSTVWSWLFAGKRAQEENARLRSEIARLKVENQNLQAGVIEAARLRAHLAFAEKKGRPLLAAEVVGQDPSALFDTITIARGSRDAVLVGTVVRTPDGLLGQVSDVSPLSAQVMLLTNANSGVGARVVRQGKDQGVGIVQGGGRGRPLELLYLKREDDVRPGDRVVSSGYGGVVPPDIPIGRVVSVTEDKARFLKTARVAPAASLHRAREVFLLP